MDINQYSAITDASKVTKIVNPLTKHFQIKHFRYLKLYANGSRILLSNDRDCTRFMYGTDNHYKKMWFDGEFPEQMVEGWHIWDVLRTIHAGGEISPFEQEINQQLDLYHGLSFVRKGPDFDEVYTFDANHVAIYQVDYALLKHFMLYFKQEAKKLIEKSEHERIHLPSKPVSEALFASQKKQEICNFLKQTRLSRYVLSGKHEGVYLTSKEAQCVYWLIQGKSSEEIGMIENNSKKTIECHLENVRTKLGCTKQTQIVRILIEQGLLENIEFVD